MRKAILIVAILLIAWGTIVAATGGVDVRLLGIAIRSRDPFRALVGGLALFVLLAVVYKPASIADLEWLAAHTRKHAPVLAAIMALTLGAYAVKFGSFGVGGADAYGYVNQAYDWASGQLPRPIPINVRLPFPASDELQTPLGYRLGQQPHTMVPTYAPGLPLLMAVSLLAGGCGPFFVVPICAVLLVWFTFRLGERAAGPLTGLLAALVVIVSPAVIYQAAWPMSDVPAGALWTGAALFSLGNRRRDALAAGLFAAMGLLVRPNLLVLSAVPLLQIAWNSRGTHRWARVFLYGVPLVVPVVLVAILNTMWYGAPSNSGYGAARELYLWPNVWPNIKLYSSWLWQSESPWVLVGILPFVPPFHRHANRSVIVFCVLFALATFACYASYSQFEVWWYLRFLLPAAGAVAVLIAAGLASIPRTLPQPFGAIVAGVVVWLFCASTLTFASGAGVFGRLAKSERRYVDIGEFVADDLPKNAAIFTMQHSGSVRFYSGRLTLRYDWVKKEWAKDVPSGLEHAGYHPYLLIDDFEMVQVREQFGLPADVPLPWPVRARMRDMGGITIFDLATTPGDVSPVDLQPGSRHWCEPRHY